MKSQLNYDIMRMVAGKRYYGYGEDVNNEEEARQFREIMREVNQNKTNAVLKHLNNYQYKSRTIDLCLNQQKGIVQLPIFTQTIGHFSTTIVIGLAKIIQNTSYSSKKEKHRPYNSDQLGQNCLAFIHFFRPCTDD